MDADSEWHGHVRHNRRCERHTIRKGVSNAHRVFILIPDKFAIEVGRVKITAAAVLEVHSAPETHDLGTSKWFVSVVEGERSFRRSERRQISRKERIFAMKTRLALCAVAIFVISTIAVGQQV